MEKDIVERLRSDSEDERQRFREARAILAHLLNEAADEIETLRKRVAHLEKVSAYASWTSEFYRDQIDDRPKW